jgi:hypothetical protein
MKLRVVFVRCLLLAMLLGTVSCSAGADDPADSLVDLAKRIQLVEDRQAILDVLVLYGRLLDEKDLVGYSNLFADDGIWEGGIGSAAGPDGIQDMLETVYSRVEPGQYGADYHIMSDFQVDVQGDSATSWSRWTWIVEGDEGKPIAQRSGHYEDKLVKLNGEWKFKYRLTVTELPTPGKDSEVEIFRKDHRDEE